MNDSESLALAINEDVSLLTYDPTWPAIFEAEQRSLKSLCGAHLIAIEHIGSTAIPGMSAKPIIDIMASVDSMTVADSLLNILCDAGYDTSAEYNATIGNRRWLMRHKDGHRTHHLHLLEQHSKDWIDCLAFRDALRSNGNLALEYLQLKKRLLLQYPTDREAYTQSKSAFVRDVSDNSAT